MAQVFGIGAVLLDSITVVDALPAGVAPGIGQLYPAPGEKLTASQENVLALRDQAEARRGDTATHFTQLGGPVPTAMSVHSGAGDDLILLAAVGDDPIGTDLKAQLEQRGFHLPLPQQTGRASGLSQVYLDAQTGHRSVVYASGTLDPISPTQVRPRPIQPDLLHTDAREPRALLSLGILNPAHGMRIYLDTGDFKNFSFLGRDLTTVDLMPNIGHIQLPRRAAVDAIIELERRRGLLLPPGTGDELAAVPLSVLADHVLEGLDQFRTPEGLQVERTVIVTDGDRGAGFAEYRGGKRGAGNVPAHTGPIEGFPDRVVDENGTGGLFAGAMGVAILRGVPTETAIPIASLVAASSTRHYGNRTFLSYDAAAERLTNPAQPTRGRVVDATRTRGRPPTSGTPRPGATGPSTSAGF